MPKIVITTDGTITGTTLNVDGKDITKKDKVVAIYLSAHAAYRGSCSGDLYKGGCHVEYVTMDEKDVAERKSYGTSYTNYEGGIGKKVKSQDKVEDSIIRFLGQEADVEISKLVDAIAAHCEKEGISCPDKDTLLTRNAQSLKDKATDLGVKIDG